MKVERVCRRSAKKEEESFSLYTIMVTQKDFEISEKKWGDVTLPLCSQISKLDRPDEVSFQN